MYSRQYFSRDAAAVSSVTPQLKTNCPVSSCVRGESLTTVPPFSRMMRMVFKRMSE